MCDLDIHVERERKRIKLDTEGGYRTNALEVTGNQSGVDASVCYHLGC